MLCIDVAFLTNGGTTSYPDYAAVELQSIPEPSSLVLAALGIAGAAGMIARRRAGANRR